MTTIERTTAEKQEMRSIASGWARVVRSARTLEQATECLADGLEQLVSALAVSLDEKLQRLADLEELVDALFADAPEAIDPEPLLMRLVEPETCGVPGHSLPASYVYVVGLQRAPLCYECLNAMACENEECRSFVAEALQRTTWQRIEDYSGLCPATGQPFHGAVYRALTTDGRAIIIVPDMYQADVANPKRHDADSWLPYCDAVKVWVETQAQTQLAS